MRMSGPLEAPPSRGIAQNLVHVVELTDPEMSLGKISGDRIGENWVVSCTGFVEPVAGPRCPAPAAPAAPLGRDTATVGTEFGHARRGLVTLP